MELEGRTDFGFRIVDCGFFLPRRPQRTQRILIWDAENRRPRTEDRGNQIIRKNLRI